MPPTRAGSRVPMTGGTSNLIHSTRMSGDGAGGRKRKAMRGLSKKQLYNENRGEESTGTPAKGLSKRAKRKVGERGKQGDKRGGGGSLTRTVGSSPSQPPRSVHPPTPSRGAWDSSPASEQSVALFFSSWVRGVRTCVWRKYRK